MVVVIDVAVSGLLGKIVYHCSGSEYGINCHISKPWVL